MRKLLLYFSYIGTNYRGLQSVQVRNRIKLQNNPKIVRVPDYETIQGILEQGLRKVLQHKDEIFIHLSSRTDVGVHAISSTVHCNLNDSIFTKVPFCPLQICQSLNFYLEKNETDIRIQRVVEVPQEFHCRRASSRIYLYRIALCKTNDFDNCSSLIRLSPALPITELGRAQVVPQPFDITAVQNACRVFLGTWNFRSFMKSSKATSLASSVVDKRDKIFDEDILVKTLYKVSFTKTKIDDTDWNYYYGLDTTYSKLDFYDFTIEGSGFLRRQIRRMVGALLAVGRGYIGPDFILYLLQNPNEQNWDPKVSSALSEGLYLKSVNYKNLNVLRGPLS